jgi:tetratricopeptide (TPR) repeat protein
MLQPRNISDNEKLSPDQKRSMERMMQETDLDYLSSVSFDEFKVSEEETEKLNKLIDRKINRGPGSSRAIFIALLCGLLLGISVFFVIFQKSKNHPSVYQSAEEEKTALALQNKVSPHDTLFPVLKLKPTEHYRTIDNSVPDEEVANLPLEMLPSKTLTLSQEKETEEDIVFKFTPNAPVIFIHNLKVTNYRMYYFKYSQSIDLSINVGLSAQYGSNADIEHQQLNRSNAYFAHKIIQKAMWLFNSKNTVNCIEELTLLYDFNPDDANAQFYLGMCYYQLGKYNQASRFFQKNLSNINNIFHQESEFYQALCLLNTDHILEATKLLENIISNKGFYSVRAKEILEKKNK